MTYAQLPRQPRPGVTLYCPVCDQHFSAYRGDYFQAAPDALILCGNTDESLSAQLGTAVPCNASLYLVIRQAAPQRFIAPADADERPQR